MKFCSLKVAVLLLVCSTNSLQADVWDHTFRMKMTNANGSGLENPLVRVGFNPQPEPPAHRSKLKLKSPTIMEMLVDDISVADGNMRIMFGIAAPFRITAEGEEKDGAYQFRIDGIDSRDSFTVQLDMLTKGGGIPNSGSWKAFNPQPEPPALGLDATGIGFDFSFDSEVTSASLDLQILHTSSGTPQSFNFAPVPEPGSMALLGLVSTLGLLRRRRSLFHSSRI